MPNYRRYYIPGRAVFVTIVTHDRNPWLADDLAVKTLLDSIHRVKALNPFRHLAHVILPDHLHWLLAPAIPNDPRELSLLSNET